MKIKKAKVAYKVCRGVLGRTFSAIPRHTDVKYELDRVTRPKPNKNPFLFVFNTKKNALKFRMDMNKISIPLSIRFANYTIFRGLAINPAMTGKRIDCDYITSTDYPKGTFFCDAFVPLEMVDTWPPKAPTVTIL